LLFTNTKMKKQSISPARQKLLKYRHKARIKARRPMHKKFLLHPVTVLVLLCTGVLLAGWTWQTSALDYVVKAKIPAPALTEPAVIIQPKDGERFVAKPIPVSGTCPYKSYIKIFRNDQFAGAALCNPDGSFGLQVDLVAGSNKLQAHIFNITDDEGPLSTAMVVYYDPPAVPEPQPAASAPTPAKPAVKPIVPPLVITSDYTYQGHITGEPAHWQLAVSGGAAPYALNVKWGDETEDNYVMKAAGGITVDHSYKKAGTYTLKIKGTDLNGATAYLQMGALVVNDKHALISAGALGPPNILTDQPQALMRWLWPAYAVMALMVVSFWLGERQEFNVLTRATNPKRLKRR
jgi:hypothetical protein